MGACVALRAALVQDVLAHAAVRHHVAGDLGARDGGIAAQLALVRLLSRVRPPVLVEVGAVFERLK